MQHRHRRSSERLCRGEDSLRQATLSQRRTHLAPSTAAKPSLSFPSKTDDRGLEFESQSASSLLDVDLPQTAFPPQPPLLPSRQAKHKDLVSASPLTTPRPPLPTRPGRFSREGNLASSSGEDGVPSPRSLPRFLTLNQRWKRFSLKTKTAFSGLSPGQPAGPPPSPPLNPPFPSNPFSFPFSPSRQTAAGGFGAPCSEPTVSTKMRSSGEGELASQSPPSLCGRLSNEAPVESCADSASSQTPSISRARRDSGRVRPSQSSERRYATHDEEPVLPGSTGRRHESVESIKVSSQRATQLPVQSSSEAGSRAVLEGRHRRREAGRLGRRFWPRAFSSSAKSVAGFVFARCSEARLLIPCLLGDPVSALDVKERSGVAAGTLFGRVVFFKLNPEDKEETAALQSPRGKAQLFQAFAPDAASGCWVDDGVLTAVFGVCEVVQWSTASLKKLGEERLCFTPCSSLTSSLGPTLRLIRRQRRFSPWGGLHKWSPKILAISLAFMLPPESLSRKALLSTASSPSLASELLSFEEECLKASFAGSDGKRTVCALGSGTACLLDFKSGQLLKDYKRSFFSRLQRATETASLTPLDCSGDFFLCCSRDGGSEPKTLTVFDARAFAADVDDAQSWSSRTSILVGAAVYRRKVSPRFSFARFFSGGCFLLIVSGRRVELLDLRPSVFNHFRKQLSEKNLIPKEPVPSRDSSATDAAFPLCQALLSCFQRSFFYHERRQRERNREGRAFFTSERRRKAAACAERSASFQKESLSPESEEGHPFFLFELSPLAVRLCGALFDAAVLAIAKNKGRQQTNKESTGAEDGSSSEPKTGDPPPCALKPLRVFAAGGRVVAFDSERTDFLFCLLTREGFLKTFSIFSKEPLSHAKIDSAVFAAGWPYLLTSDGGLVAFSSDKGVFGLRLPPEVKREAAAKAAASYKTCPSTRAFVGV